MSELFIIEDYYIWAMSLKEAQTHYRDKISTF
jgi:hypothetical protein